MSKFKVQMKLKFQNEKYFDIRSFDIDLAFGLWHLKF